MDQVIAIFTPRAACMRRVVPPLGSPHGRPGAPMCRGTLCANSQRREVPGAPPRAVYHRKTVGVDEVVVSGGDAVGGRGGKCDAREPLLNAQLSQAPQSGEFTPAAPLGVALPEIPHGERDRKARGGRLCLEVRVALVRAAALLRGARAQERGAAATTASPVLWEVGV